jgi:hypothetical protein
MINFKDYIKFTEWGRLWDFLGLGCLGYLCCEAVASNNKKYKLQLADSCFISDFDIENNKDNLDVLKNIVKENSIISINELVNDYLTQRKGIKGYKGLFKIKELIPLKV